MPTGIWPLVSGRRPMASVCPAYYFRPWEHSLGHLDSEVKRRLKMSFSLGHLGHLSKTPTVTKAYVACVSFHSLLASYHDTYPCALTSQVHTLP